MICNLKTKKAKLMKSTIIKKWIEPYKLLETIKKYYDCLDYTFDGKTKFEYMQEFVDKLSNNKNSIGLYMKNVNKYYLFTNNNPVDILTELKIQLNLQDTDLEDISDYQTSLNLVDLGKCEASIIFPN